MAKIPYLFRRKNIYYFRVRIPLNLRKSYGASEIIQSLKTQIKAEAVPLALELAAHATKLFNEAKMSENMVHKRQIAALRAKLEIKEALHNEEIEQKELDHIRELRRTEREALLTGENTALKQNQTTPKPTAKPKGPLLSFVVSDFLSRYDKNNKEMLAKLVSTLPIFVELVGDKPINDILQADINGYFDEVQKLPVRRDKKEFNGLSIRQIIEANTGPCLAQKTFKSTYKACVSVLFEWLRVNYQDQGFPNLSVKGAIYRGDRLNDINKQRAIRPEELQTLFNNPKMEKYAANPKTAHYCWLPLIGLYTGARINEVCQLNPFDDIKLDDATGIYYFHFTDEGETALGVDKSIKTNSSRRIVPIHSKLIDLGLLDYVEKIKKTGHKIIFPEWRPLSGKASANAGKWFTRYIKEVGLKDDTTGARLSGFHSFRHTFVTHGMTNKIQGLFAITGHETEVVDGFGQISAVAKGYWTRGLTDNIQELKETIEKFDFNLQFCKPFLV